MQASTAGTAMGNIRNAPSSSKQGVALIIVLGFVSLLAILGVTFTTITRVERSAAGNFHDSVRTHMALQFGINSALAQIDGDFGIGGFPTSAAWSNDVFATAGGGTTLSGTDLIGSLGGLYCPGALADAVSNATPSWIEVDIDNAEVRVAYTILNCSGLLDAQSVGGKTNRMAGTNVEEIILTELPEMNSTNAFVVDRNRHVQYESLAEFWELQRDDGSGFEYGLETWPASFIHFSRAPKGFYNPNLAGPLADPTLTNVVSLRGDAAELITKSNEIVTALLENMENTTADDAAFVFQNLLDYVDPDSIPRDVGSGNTEPVPMFNEAQVVSSVVYTSPDDCLAVIELSVEWWYPFVEANTGQYTIAYVMRGTQVGTAPAAVFDPFNAAGSVAGTTPSTYNNNTNRIHPVSATFAVSAPITGCSNYIGMTVQYDIDLELLMLQGTDIVDAVPIPSNHLDWTTATLPLKLTTTAVTVNPSATNELGMINETNGLECLDPRINWSADPGVAHWLAYDVLESVVPLAKLGSMNSTNFYMSMYFDGVDMEDNHTHMYVANKNLSQVGELSYLLRSDQWSASAWWQTIRTTQQGNFAPDRIFDVFRIHPPPEIMRGYLNPNTRQTNALAALLYQMPLNVYPGQNEDDFDRIAWGEAQSIAEQWINESQSAFTNLSDVGHMTNIVNTHPVLSGLHPLAKEGFLHNLTGLMSTRQQIFVIVVAAQRYGTGEVWIDARGGVPGLINPGSPTAWLTSIESLQRAVAVVWRDPFPDVDGRHAYIVRDIRYLLQ